MIKPARLLIVVLVFLTAEAFARGPSAGRGGPFIEYHSSNLSKFDSGLSGNTVFIGGVGYGATGKRFRIGGGGAAGFVWDSSTNADFGIGYGGVIGEYSVSPWLAVSLMMGGGGFSVAKITSQSNLSVSFDKIASGGFILFYPQISAEVGINKNTITVAAKAGYFLPNEGRLHSFTFTICLMFGKI